MKTQSRTWYVIGATLAVSGCFLPWGHEGDFVTYRTIGIRISSMRPWLQDNGGLLVVVMSLAIIALKSFKAAFIKKPSSWTLAASVLLVLDSVYQIARWVLKNIAAQGVIGAPGPDFGLAIVFAGSIILLGTSISDYRNRAA